MLKHQSEPSDLVIQCVQHVIMFLFCAVIVYTDYIDIVVDHVPHSEYKEEEDPRIYK